MATLVFGLLRRALPGLELLWGVLMLVAVSSPAFTADSFRDCDGCPEMVEIPAGTFVMGSSPEALAKDGVIEPFAASEQPRYEATIEVPFAIGKYPVTRTEYARFVQETGQTAGGSCWSWNISAGAYQYQDNLTWRDPGFPQTPEHPAVCVSWEDALAYAHWLSDVTGKAYRLPTEAEREYVGRSGTGTSWPWSGARKDVCRYGNVSDLSRLDAHTSTQRSQQTVFNCEDGYVYTSPVGSFQANAFGVYDTVGNTWEWTADCFDDAYGSAPEEVRPETGPGLCDQRVLRGGSWFTLTFLNRPASRYGAAPGDRSGHVGFRVARSLQ